MGLVEDISICLRQNVLYIFAEEEIGALLKLSKMHFDAASIGRSR